MWRGVADRRRFLGTYPQSPANPTGSPGRTLVVGFLLAVLAFAASSTLTGLRLRSVSRPSREISASAMPRVLELATLRQDLHRVEDDLYAAVDGQAADLTDLARRLDALDAQAAAYAGRTEDSRDDGTWKHASASIASTVAGARRVREQLMSGDVPGARAALHDRVWPAASIADTDLWQLVRSSATDGVEAARVIESIHQDVAGMSIALDALCAAFSAVLAVLALRAMKRHTRFIEERSAELEQFAVRVAHDLRGPLQPVTLALQLARMHLPEGDAKRSMIDRAVASAGRLGALIQDLLTFAQAGGRPERGRHTSARAAVEAVLDEVSGQAATVNVELRAERAVEASVACSSGVFASLLSNLVRNAVKYMGDAPVRRITVAVRPQSGRVRVEVRDTGPGLPPGASAHVFEPYVRADRSGQPGLGLGLATVKRLAEAHGGAVGVDSSSAGSVFWFELPEAPSVCLDESSEPGMLRTDG
jgi:signal transduction histidine kinase